MRYTAAWPLLAILLVTAAASCGAAAAATPLLPHLASSMRTGRLLQAPAKSAAAPPTFVGKNETVVPDTLDQNTEQVKIVDLFSDKELPANRAVHLTDSYYRVVGTQVSTTNEPFLEAMRSSLSSVFSLFNVTPVVSILPAATATRKAAVTRRLLQAGALTDPGGPGVLFQGGSAGASPLARAKSLPVNFAAVVAKVESYITRDTTFSRIMQGQALNQHRLIEGNLAAFGYQVAVVPEGTLIPDGGLAVLLRLPPSVTLYTQSFTQGIFRFSGVGTVSVAAQSALLAFADEKLPLSYISANVTGISPKGNRTFDVAVRFVIGKSLQDFSPQDLQQALGPTVAVRMAAAGVPGDVTLLSTRSGTDLDPFILEEQAIAAGCCKHITTVPIPDSKAGGGGGGISSGAVAGIVVGIVAVVLLAVVLLALWWRRRRRHAAALAAAEAYASGNSAGKGKSSASQLADQPLQGWAVLPEQLEVCRHADGSEWLLGAGASGKVVKALRGGVQDVAVKQLLHTNAAAVEKFLEEVSILRSLNYDRNVVQFYGACLQEGSDPMLVTEYMEGGDLCSAIERDADGELKWHRDGHHIALDIAKGLYFLHSHDVMHGDLKSRNVLLTRARTAKIADIGLARIVDPGSQASSEQWTFAYAAPEVILGQDAGLKSDIFSMGVVLHEIVTGIMPVTRGNLPEPSVPDECPQDVLYLIHACTAADPGLRPTAKEVFTVLQRSCEAHVPKFRAAADTAAAANVAANKAAGRGSSDEKSGSCNGDLMRRSVAAALLKDSQKGPRNGSHAPLRGGVPAAQQQQLADSISKHSASSIDMGLAPELVRQRANGTAAGGAPGSSNAALGSNPPATEQHQPLPLNHPAAGGNQAQQQPQEQPHQLSFGSGMTPGPSMEYGSAEVTEVLSAVDAHGDSSAANALRAAAAAAAAAAGAGTNGNSEPAGTAAQRRDVRSGSALYGDDPVTELPPFGSGESIEPRPSVRHPSASDIGMYSSFE